MSEHLTQSTFEGFEPANTTPVPDVLFDVLVGELNESELKVLLYIIRRTAGFKKQTDPISLSQFEHGIKRKDGTVLDNGVGFSQQQICRALSSLVKRGLITRQQVETPDGGKQPTVYSIKYKQHTDMDVSTHLTWMSDGVVSSMSDGVVSPMSDTRNSNTRNSKQDNNIPAKSKSKNPLTLQGQHILDVYQTFKGRKSTPGKATIDAANGLVSIVTDDEELLLVLQDIEDDPFLNEKNIARDLDFVYRKYEKHRDVVERKKTHRQNGHRGPKPNPADDLPIFRAEVKR